LFISADAKVLFEDYEVKSIGVMLGQTGPSAKNIVILDTVSGDILFLKVAKSMLSYELIRKEKEALKFLSEKEVSFVTPNLLDSGESYLLTTSIGTIIQSKVWSNLHSAFIKELNSLHSIKTLPREFLKSEIEAERLYLLPESIELFCSHGDLTPWNMTLIDDKLHIIDWEMFGLRPIAYDLFHFHIQGLIMNTDMDGINILRVVERDCRSKFDGFVYANIPFSQALLLYLLTVRMEYKRIYRDNNELHWQAKRAIKIWNQMIELIYERVLTGFN
jgi:hypothetical protein